MNEVVILSSCRTPIGKFGGGLSSLSASELGGIVVREAIRRAGISPEMVDEVIMGNARSAGVGPNPARQMAYRGGVPHTVPAFTINKACGSSLRAIISASQAILLGDAEVVVAGGSECMSQTPYLLPRARWGYRLGHGEVVDGMYRDGFLCPLCGQVMGETAENLVEKYQISRHEQDQYAAESQQKCEKARKEGVFAQEIVPVTVRGVSGSSQGKETVVREDEHPRNGVTAESLSRLAPVFKEEGTIHAGNSSGIVDGASAVVVANSARARALGLQPLARVKAYTLAGVDPAHMGIGPVPAVQQLLSRTGMKLSQIDLIELNEAFAAQVLACDRELHLNQEKLNVNGGAIPLGHPIGATGARIVTTLLHEMVRRDARCGLATLCISGGMGIAVLFERSLHHGICQDQD